MDDLDALQAQVNELIESHEVNAMQNSVTEAEGTRKTALQQQEQSCSCYVKKQQS